MQLGDIVKEPPIKSLQTAEVYSGISGSSRIQTKIQSQPCQVPYHKIRGLSETLKDPEARLKA